MKSGCSGALKPDKANKCCDAGTEGLGVLTTHETFSLGDAGSTNLKHKSVVSNQILTPDRIVELKDATATSIYSKYT